MTDTLNDRIAKFRDEGPNPPSYDKEIACALLADCQQRILELEQLYDDAKMGCEMVQLELRRTGLGWKETVTERNNLQSDALRKDRTIIALNDQYREKRDGLETAEQRIQNLEAELQAAKDALAESRENVAVHASVIAARDEEVKKRSKK